MGRTPPPTTEQNTLRSFFAPFPSLNLPVHTFSRTSLSKNQAAFWGFFIVESSLVV